MPLIDSLEIEADYLIPSAAVMATYRWVLGEDERHCHAVVTHTRIYFDTPSHALARSRSVVALTARPDGRLSVVCKTARPTGLGAALMKQEHALIVRAPQDLSQALAAHARRLTLDEDLRPSMTLRATRHYRVLRREQPAVHVSLDAVVANAPGLVDVERHFLELELNGSGATSLFAAADRRIRRRDGPLRPIESKYAYFMSTMTEYGDHHA